MGKSSSLSPSSSSRTLPSMFSGSDRRRGSLRSMAEVTGSYSDPARNYRSRLCFHGGVPDEGEESHYFLDSCFRCKTPLHEEDDIYMYRGDTPFCSEECREEQIEIDEAEERRRCKAKKKRMMLMMGSSAAAASPSSCHEIHVRAAAGALVAR